MLSKAHGASARMCFFYDRQMSIEKHNIYHQLTHLTFYACEPIFVLILSLEMNDIVLGKDMYAKDY